MSTSRERLRDFAGNSDGAIAIIFALALLPMTMLAGAAIDYSMAVRHDSRVRAAADAAALSAARDIAFSPAGATATGKDVAHSKARDVFKNNLRRAQALRDAQVDLSSTDVGGQIVTTARYSAYVEPYSAKLLGLRRIPIAGVAQASVSRPTYKNFFLVIDISSSMGIPSTAAGIAAMKSETGCAMACHDGSGLDYARKKNIQLRLDVIKQNAKEILNYVAGSESGVNYSRFGVYTLQHKLTALNGALGVLSTNYTQLSSIVDKIDFEVPYRGSPPSGSTYYDLSFAKLLPDLPPSGDGSTPATAVNYVLIMTDGVTSLSGKDQPPFVAQNGVCTSRHCTAPIDPALCKPFKDKGATVGVVYTTYLDVGYTYPTLVAPFASKIRPYLQSCASPGFFYEGTSGTEIAKAMMDLYLSTVGSGKVRLTN